MDLCTKQISVVRPRMQVRIEPDVEKAIRRAVAQTDRSVQTEVNRSLRIYYATTGNALKPL